jgi:hypothetical protein
MSCRTSRILAKPSPPTLRDGDRPRQIALTQTTQASAERHRF